MLIAEIKGRLHKAGVTNRAAEVEISWLFIPSMSEAPKTLDSAFPIITLKSPLQSFNVPFSVEPYTSSL